MPYETPVIPAKAGIQSVNSAFPKVCGVDSRFRGNDCDLERPSLAKVSGMDSRFRGNDCGLERPCLANDTTTGTALHLSFWTLWGIVTREELCYGQ